MALKLRLKRKKEGPPIDLTKPIHEPDFGVKPAYLENYISSIREEIGEPMIVDRLRGEMKKWREFNIIYPIGAGIFIHAYSPRDSGTGYNRYIIIEPPKPPENLFRTIEEVLAIHIDSDYIPRSSEEKRAILLYLLEKILQPSEKVDYEKIEIKRGKIPVNKQDLDYIKYHLIRDKVGVGILEPFLRDPYIEDISMSGLGNIFIVHKMFGPMESNMGFKKEEELDAYIIKLGEKIGKPISTARPVVDATLPDGSRINIVFGTDVSLRGSNFTIRRVAKTPISLTQLIDWGTFDSRIAAYIWMMLNEGMSMFVCGETASGKTTSLNAVSAFIRPNAKIVTIEDTAEVVLPHPNWTRELTRDTGRQESSVTMFDLLRAALRQRPNYIIVGEIRGAEGNIAFQAMQSVTWETPVLVRIQGRKPRLATIGEVVDQYFNGGEEGRKHTQNLQVLSLSPRGKIVWSPVKYVLRHRAKKIYEITYANGRKVRMTGSHSIFVLDKKEFLIVPKLVENLQKGDIIVLVKPRRKPSLLDRLLGIKRNGLSIISSEGLEISNEIENNTASIWFKILYDKRPRRFPLEPLIDYYNTNGLVLSSRMKYLTTRLRNGEQKYVLKKTVEELIKKITTNGYPRNIREVAKRIKLLLDSDIELVYVEDIQKKEYDGYVYDFSVPQTELFVGGEAPIALHNTGHPVMATFHAANLDRLIQRLTNHPINVPKTNMDSLNLAWFQSAVYVKGFPARRVIEIDEIIGYDPQSDAIAAMPVFTWDPVTDRFIFAGRGASYLLEEKIAVMRGLPRSRIAEIYDELEMRRRYIQLLVDRKIFEYDKVFKAIIYASQVGIETALKRLEKDKITF